MSLVIHISSNSGLYPGHCGCYMNSVLILRVLILLKLTINLVGLKLPIASSDLQLKSQLINFSVSKFSPTQQWFWKHPEIWAKFIQRFGDFFFSDLSFLGCYPKFCMAMVNLISVLQFLRPENYSFLSEF